MQDKLPEYLLQDDKSGLNNVSLKGSKIKNSIKFDKNNKFKNSLSNDTNCL